jgi:putative endonuclease
MSYYVYIMTNRAGTLYTGMTNDIKRRAYEHKHHTFEGFTSRYRVDRLVYYEALSSFGKAESRERQIKGWLRRKKVELIDSANPLWVDLSDGWYLESPDPSLRSG